VELFNEKTYQHFLQDDIRLATSLAAQAAVAVENAQLYTQAQIEIEEKLRAEERANRYLSQQLIVNQLALSLGQLTRLNDIYEEIFEQVSSVMPVDLFIISFYDEDAKMIRAGYVYAYGKVLDVAVFPELPLAQDGKGIQSQVIRTGKPVYVADRSDVINNVQTHHAIHETGEISDNSVPANKEDVAHSHLHVPMMIGGKPIGVMQIQHQEKNAYTRANIDLLAGLANMAAIAIQNARLLQKTREQGLQVEQIVSSVPDGVLLLDPNKRLMMANPAANKYLSLLAAVEVGEIVDCLGERPLSELLESPPNGLWHEVVGGSRYFDVVSRAIEAGSSFVGGWVMVIHDVTREKENQTRLEQQTRLAAVGQLAAGIAHDFNNIMTVISLYTDLVDRSEENLSPQTQKRLKVISQQSNRAADLIEQILDFSRRSVLERRTMDFLPFLKEVIKLLDRTLIENIHINLNVEPGSYIVNADPTRMQQMVMNLAVNARDAMPHGGELNFSLSSLCLHDSANEIDVELQPGHWLKLQVSDNGTGIEPTVLPHVFDPFFTTKQPGRGSGLGLAQVWGIVQQHEGHISVTTVEDRGTTFTLYLPLYHQDTPVPPEAVPLDVIDGSKETILVVEDNVMTREVLVESLHTLNYEVITAVHGLNALEIMKIQGDCIALIISDVVMPEMGGIALLKTLRIGGWETAVLLLTGHPLNKELDEALTYTNVEWMSKPVTLEQLADAVSRRLNSVP
jgi:signal transduction histidine kinase/ActR/RegA family two-component response regulator